MIAMYQTMVTVSTFAIYVLEHASLFNAFRTALVAAVGRKKFAPRLGLDVALVVNAAAEQIEQSEENVRLHEQSLALGRHSFEEGDIDLLALNI